MQANIVTLIRIILVFFALWLFTVKNFYTQLAACLLTIIIIFMDAVDGYVARKLKVSSKVGALFDITGDRIVENVYWVFFAGIKMIPVWVPIIVIARSFIIDFIRTLAFIHNKTPFGETTMMKSKITKFLVASPFSRTTYAVSKVLVFCYLGALLAFRTAIKTFSLDIPRYVISSLSILTIFIVSVTVIFCILRGIPVLIDGWEYFTEKRYPTDIVKGL